jgi:hypothetical protein
MIDYPKYGKAHDDGDATDFSIVKNLVQKHKQNPQTILNDIMNIYCNDGNRYSGEMLNSGNCEIIDYLLKEGATLTRDMFFNWQMEDFDIDIGSNNVRAALIDHYFPRLGFTADEYNDIEPFDEEEDFDDDEEDYENPIVQGNILKGDLKFKSKFLTDPEECKKEYMKMRKYMKRFIPPIPLAV